MLDRKQALEGLQMERDRLLYSFTSLKIAFPLGEGIMM
jgi:hypothetical protein